MVYITLIDVQSLVGAMDEVLLVVVLGSLRIARLSRVRGRGAVASGLVAEIAHVVIRPLGGRTGAALLSFTGTNPRTGGQWLRDSGTPRHLEPRQAPGHWNLGTWNPEQSTGSNPQESLQDSRCGIRTKGCKHKRGESGFESRWTLLWCLAPALPP